MSCFVFLLSQAREHPADRLRQRQQLLLGDEVVEQLGLMGNRPEATTDVELEAALLDAVLFSHDRHRTDVVHVCQAAAMARTAREGDLELTPEVLGVLVAEQEVGKSLRVQRDIEDLVATNARLGASRDVAHRVPARLSCRHTARCEAPHHRRRIVDVDVVELKVLPCRDVADAVGILLRQIGEDPHLL